MTYHEKKDCIRSILLNEVGGERIFRASMGSGGGGTVLSLIAFLPQDNVTETRVRKVHPCLSLFPPLETPLKEKALRKHPSDHIDLLSPRTRAGELSHPDPCLCPFLSNTRYWKVSQVPPRLTFFCPIS